MLECDFRGVDWAAAPLDAATQFHAQVVPQLRELADPASAFWQEQSAAPESLDAMAVILPPADHAHHGWRLAAVQELARELAPVRVNAVVGAGDEAGDEAVREALAYLAAAPGVTGQVLAVDAIAGEMG